MKVAIIVNDLAELKNIDAKLVRNITTNSLKEKMVEMQNGCICCICCTLRGDLLVELKKLAMEGLITL